jgi:superfamily II DNA or RNA helicase
MDSSKNSVLAERPVYLTREGGTFKLSFKYQPEIVAEVRKLPGARFDGETRSWTCAVCLQSVEALREWYLNGWSDVSVDTLVSAGENIQAARPAVLRSGTLRRPYQVVTNVRSEELYARLRAVNGATWDKKSGSITYPPSAVAALIELVERGVIEDPDNLLNPAEIVVAYDGRTGKFTVKGDSRAEEAFTKSFPKHDVVEIWKERGVDVAFADQFTEEVYRGERARLGEGLNPDGLSIQLYPYQAQSVALGVARSGIGVFHEMGLGKTAVAIAVGYESMVNRKEIERVCVVVPGAVKTQWAREIERFTGCSDIVIVDGEKKKRHAAYKEAKEKRWMIVNYDVLHTDLALIGPLVSGAMLVIDEAHRIKSPTAKRTKAVRTLAMKAVKRMALSGTPIENDPGEWYSVVSGFIQPGCFGSPVDFLNRYSYPGRFGGFEGARNLGELRERSRVYYIRSTKAEVATHLPPLRVQNQSLDVDAAYANALRTAHRDARDEIKRSALERVAKSSKANGVLDGQLFDEVETGAEMTAVGMLKLLCCSPRLLWRSEAPAAKALCEAGIIPEEDGPKLDELRLMAAELQANGNRCVVFTSSKRMVDLVAERFDADKIRYVVFTGESSTADRDAAVAAFCGDGDDQNPAPTVFLATDAGGEGLNLGKKCSLLINLDIPWTPGRLTQRSARIHRLDGEHNSYLVINMTLRGTIEEGILKLVERKADLADAIFGEEGGRRRATGRGGRKTVFEEAMEDWENNQ